MKRSPVPITSQRELYERALKLLTQKSRSQWELRRLLAKRCREESLIAAVIDKCIALGYLDDVQYATHLARDHAERKRHGRRRVAQELRARGLSMHIVELALKEVFSQVDEGAVLRRAVETRVRNTPGKWDTRKKKKLYDQLVRDGFNTDAILRELRRHRISVTGEADPVPVEEAEFSPGSSEEEPV
jgi:regulatory protein